MTSTRTGGVAARFEAVRRRFELWRSRRQRGERIPERLWSAAVKVAVAEGLAPTARILGLGYNALNKRVEAADPCGGSVRLMPLRKTSGRNASTGKESTAKALAQNSATTFVELPPLEPREASECIVELEHPRGTKMRIRLTGRQNPDVVAAVSRAFFGAGS